MQTFERDLCQKVLSYHLSRVEEKIFSNLCEMKFEVLIKEDKYTPAQMVEHFVDVIGDQLCKVRLQADLFESSDYEEPGNNLKSMAERLYESSFSRIFSGTLELIVLKTSQIRFIVKS